MSIVIAKVLGATNHKGTRIKVSAPGRDFPAKTFSRDYSVTLDQDVTGIIRAYLANYTNESWAGQYALAWQGDTVVAVSVDDHNTITVS